MAILGGQKSDFSDFQKFSENFGLALFLDLPIFFENWQNFRRLAYEGFYFWSLQKVWTNAIFETPKIGAKILKIFGAWGYGIISKLYVSLGF